MQKLVTIFFGLSLVVFTDQKQLKMCIKNATKIFDVYSTNCFNNTDYKWVEKEMLVLIKRKNLIKGFGYKCSKKEIILQTGERKDTDIKLIADTSIQVPVSVRECQYMKENHV